MFAQIWLLFFAWMPIPLQIAFFAFLAVVGIVFVLRVIALVLDAIPIF